jgi:predicted RNase H-like HicB family nuclease
MQQLALRVDVHHEEGSYWAEVRELPGCFAAGHSIAELIDSVEEGVALYLASPGSEPPWVKVELAGLDLSLEPERPPRVM